MYDVEWSKCTHDNWCDLFKLDLEHKYLQGINGVYILWYETDKRNIIKVGQGDVAKSLIAEKSDLAIQAFAHHGLKVTWADVSTFKRKGVFNWLSDTLKPKIPVDQPKSSPVEVNLPW
jgi:hypothetical protein